MLDLKWNNLVFNILLQTELKMEFVKMLQEKVSATIPVIIGYADSWILLSSEYADH